MAAIGGALIGVRAVPDFFIGKTLAFPLECGIVPMAIGPGMKISDISWDTVRMVSIDQCTLRITTDIAVHTFAFETADELSEALLILSLKGTKKVEFMDDSRFNPARFLPGYDRPARRSRFGMSALSTDRPGRTAI
jgi:hypothetical protein